MIDINILTSDLLSFISSNKETIHPTLLDPSLQDITPIIEVFRQNQNDIQSIQKLSKYCAFYKNYPLANKLLNWGIHLYPDHYQYHYFQAILYFKQRNIPDSLSAIENMLNSMNASEIQKKTPFKPTLR